MIWLQRQNVERESVCQENPESGTMRREERIIEGIIEKLRKFPVSKRHDTVSIGKVGHNREQEVTSVGLWRRLSRTRVWIPRTLINAKQV